MRINIRILVVSRDAGNLKDCVSEIGVHGKTSKARPNTLVTHWVLVRVIPSVGDVQWFHGTDTAVVTGTVKGPGLAGAGSADPVDGAELDGLEGGVLSAVDGGAHRLLLPRLLVKPV